MYNDNMPNIWRGLFWQLRSHSPILTATKLTRYTVLYTVLVLYYSSIANDSIRTNVQRRPKTLPGEH